MFLIECLPLFRLNPCGISQSLFPLKEKSITCGRSLICFSVWEFQRDVFSAPLLQQLWSCSLPAQFSFAPSSSRTGIPGMIRAVGSALSVLPCPGAVGGQEGKGKWKRDGERKKGRKRERERKGKKKKGREGSLC